MCVKILISILFCNSVLTKADNNSTNSDVAHNIVNSIANTIVTFLSNPTENKRINELKTKLQNINKYVVDKDKFAELIQNETDDTNLTKINFFKALNEDDHYRFLTDKEPKSLYLKLKEKMTRDDIINTLANASDSRLKKSARRMMHSNVSSRKRDREIDDAVDKFLSRKPSDDHEFDFKNSNSPYWDPKSELENLRDYHQDGRRLYKGERSTVRSFPFMVSIHMMGRFWCGGSLFWHDLVLTSAACLQLLHNNRFFRENPRVLQVRVGSNHSRIGGELIDALEVYFHPGYNPKTLQNNIAGIRLRRHLAFSYHRVPKIIELSHNEEQPPSTGEVLVLGWGVTRTSQKLAYEPIFLQKKVLPIYPTTFCKEVYGDKFITTSMFCAGTITTGEGACDHDAGGPAILGGKLVGIISFGPSVCGYPNAPTVFTMVGAYADWIETVNESMPQYYVGKARTTRRTSHLVMYNVGQGTPTRGSVAPIGETTTVAPGEQKPMPEVRIGQMSDYDGLSS